MSASAVAPACMRCGQALRASQEYCLGCGLRRPGPGRFGAAPVEGRPLTPRLLALCAVGLVGGGLAIALTHDPDASVEIVTATGGSVTTEQAAPAPRPQAAPATWPRDVDGWTIVLVSVPKVQGRKAALDVASAARARRLTEVGVLDSSSRASLHPGYWLVWSGRYESEAEATSALLRARTFTKSARVQRIAG